MELYPILEVLQPPTPGLWNALSTSGEHPSMRVGLVCVYVQLKGVPHICVTGGANPSELFNDVYLLNLSTMAWDIIDVPNFFGRYEHMAFSVPDRPHQVYVFGGAGMNGCLNDMQCIDLEEETCTDVSCFGEIPAARTQHTVARWGDKVYVYSGGLTGTQCTKDRKLYSFDIRSKTWMTVSGKGDPPKPRQGHIMFVIESCLYVHGGMSGDEFYDDLHQFNLEVPAWKNIKKATGWPCKRSGHGCCVDDTKAYLFGGLAPPDQALSDFFVFDPKIRTFSLMCITGNPPPNRLDFGMTLMPWTISENGTGSGLSLCTAAKNQDVSNASDGEPDKQMACVGDADGSTCLQAEPDSPKQTEQNLCLVMCGMDAAGEIFDDSFVFLVS